jgi:TolB protein
LLIARLVSSEPVLESQSAPNRIAFVGNDGNLWLAAPETGELSHITLDGRGYRSPTWSPDGRRLAFIGPDGGSAAALHVFDRGRDEHEVLYSSRVSAPFYVYWSPDSRSVTFLTQESAGLAMRVADAYQPDSDWMMAQGQPFYWTWSPRGDQVFMHVGGAGAFAENAHLSFLANREGAPRVEMKLTPGRFQAPVWSASGQYVYYVAADENGGDAIYKTEMATDQQTLVTTLSGSSYMVLSPDDEHIAYMQLQRGEGFPALGAAHILELESGNKRRVLEHWVAAMYWSPDGKKLALLTPAQGDENPVARVPGLAAPLAQENRFRWWVYDLEAETLDPLLPFVPTLQFIQTVSFFDQYHLSLTFWSPDSRYLVITKGQDGQEDGEVWILDTTGKEAPRQIAEGTFAVWSWQ